MFSAPLHARNGFTERLQVRHMKIKPVNRLLAPGYFFFFKQKTAYEIEHPHPIEIQHLIHFPYAFADGIRTVGCRPAQAGGSVPDYGTFPFLMREGPRPQFLIQIRHALGAPLPSLCFRISVRRFAHLLALFWEECKSSDAFHEPYQRFLRRRDGNLDSRLWRNKSPYTLVIQSQDRQAMAHRFQNLCAKGIL